MVLRLLVLATCVALGGEARATALEVSAEAPLSAERLSDALRSYVEGAEVAVGATDDVAEGAETPDRRVRIRLRGSHAVGEDAEVVVADRDETVVARLPGALRSEDLYRAAALKVQTLLQRRQAAEAPAAPVDAIATAPPAPAPPREGRLLLDVGLGWMQPTAGQARQALRLGTGLRLGNRWRTRLAAYLEPSESSYPQGVAVSSWELPVELTLGLALHQGRWQSFIEAIGQVALHRLSAEAPGLVSTTETTLAPRAGAGVTFALAMTQGLWAEARLSLLAAVQDTRYHVDGNLVWPAARALAMLELGLLYGGR
jgi:hypothetical protein